MTFPNKKPAQGRSSHSRYSRPALASAVVLAGVLALTACGNGGSGPGASGEEQIELSVSTMAVEGTPNALVQDWFVKEVEARTDGRLTFDVMPPEALCAAPEIVVCVQDGRADVGVSIPAYTPDLFPDSAVVEIPFIGQSGSAVTQALWTAHNEHEGVQANYDELGLKLASMWPNGRLLFGAEEPVEGIEDIEGLQVRASGTGVQTAIEAAGGNIVALTIAETYEGIQRGVADSVAVAIDGPVNYKFMELLPNWTDPGYGHYNTFAMWFNQDVYEGLPDDIRSTVDEVMEELNSGAAMEAFSEGTDQQCQQMLDSPNVETMTAWSDKATAEWEELLGGRVQEAWIEKATSKGLEDAEGYLKGYKKLLSDYESDDNLDPVVECVQRFTEK